LFVLAIMVKAADRKCYIFLHEVNNEGAEDEYNSCS
jgi:hypothetical protein